MQCENVGLYNTTNDDNYSITYEEMKTDNIINVSDYPTAIEIVETDVYSHSVSYCSDRHEIMFTLTNTSDYWYLFGQFQSAFKLIDNEWFRISGNVYVQLWADQIPSNSSINRSLNPGVFAGLNRIPLPAGVYLFEKPLYRIICRESRSAENWVIDSQNPIMHHLILEVE